MKNLPLPILFCCLSVFSGCSNTDTGNGQMDPGTATRLSVAYEPTPPPAKATPPKKPPPPIEFFCTCGKVLEVPASHAGSAERCPHCSASMKVPAAGTGSIRTIDYYAESNQYKLDGLLATELDAGRIPIVYFWASWCKPCQAFKVSLNDPLMQAALKDVTLIMIDIEVDGGKEKIFDSYKLDGVPTFLRLTDEEHITSGEWEEDIPKNMAPVLDEFVHK